MKKPTMIKILILSLILSFIFIVALIIFMLKEPVTPEEECKSLNGEWVDLWNCCCPKKCLEMGEAMLEDFETCQCCLVEREPK